MNVSRKTIIGKLITDNQDKQIVSVKDLIIDPATGKLTAVLVSQDSFILAEEIIEFSGKGIMIRDKYNQPLLEIHNSQLISLNKTTSSELSQMDKSVVGRAVVCGLILGPIGAIVGGMSGIGSKKKVKDVS